MEEDLKKGLQTEMLFCTGEQQQYLPCPLMQSKHCLSQSSRR